MAAAPSPVDVPAALAEGLYERHWSFVLGVCRRRLRAIEDAEEAAQSTFVRALAALRRGERPRSERAWLATIARNVCTTTATTAAARREVPVGEPELQVAATSDVDVALQPELERALAALPEPQRKALLLRALGLRYDEIARELGATVAAVETWIFRARRSLAASIRRPALNATSLVTLVRSLLPASGVAKGAAVVIVAATAVGVRQAEERGAAPPFGAVQGATRSEQTPKRFATALDPAATASRRPAEPRRRALRAGTSQSRAAARTPESRRSIAGAVAPRQPPRLRPLSRPLKLLRRRPARRRRSSRRCRSRRRRSSRRCPSRHRRCRSPRRMCRSTFPSCRCRRRS